MNWNYFCFSDSSFLASCIFRVAGISFWAMGFSTASRVCRVGFSRIVPMASGIASLCVISGWVAEAGDVSGFSRVAVKAV